MLKAKGWVVGLAVALPAFAAVAMPTRAEFQKVLPLVREISAEDVAAVRAGKMKPAKAGDNAFERAKDPSIDEASRYLFHESAFSHYVRGAEYDKAAAVVASLKATVKDVPDSAVAELIERRLKKVPRKHAGQLYSLLREARVRDRLLKDLDEYRKAAAASSDKDLNVRVALAHVLLGDWAAANKAFARAGGEVAAVAGAELNGGMPHDKIADFWWSYKALDSEFSDYDDLLEDAFRSHACEWYRTALVLNTISGVKRRLIEKRIKGLAPAKAAEAGAAATVAKKEPAPAPAVKTTKSGTHQTMSIEIARGHKMEFVQCPAGTFVMGSPNDKEYANDPTHAGYRREVTISRPFWVSKYPVTVGDYEAVMGEKLSLTPAQKAVGPKMKLPVSGRDLPKNGFLGRIAKAAARQLPKGVVLRLPTEAEILAMQTDYGKLEKVSYSRPRYCYLWKDIKQLLSAKGVPIPEPGNPSKSARDDSLRGPGGVLGPVGEREPSALGLYDLFAESYPALDLVSTLANNGDGPRSPRKPKETDPLYADGKNLMAVNGKFWYSGTFWWGTLRLVIGPDLIKEKGLEDKYKDMFR